MFFSNSKMVVVLCTVKAYFCYRMLGLFPRADLHQNAHIPVQSQTIHLDRLQITMEHRNSASTTFWKHTAPNRVVLQYHTIWCLQKCCVCDAINNISTCMQITREMCSVWVWETCREPVFPIPCELDLNVYRKKYFNFMINASLG